MAFEVQQLKQVSYDKERGEENLPILDGNALYLKVKYI